MDEQTGLEIVRPEYLKGNIHKVVILICVVEEDIYRSIYEQMISCGFDKAQLYRMRDYYDRLSTAYLEKHMQKYKDVYQLLEDDFSPDDLYEIPTLIKKMNPEYKLYLRQYANSRFETVLYAL